MLIAIQVMNILFRVWTSLISESCIHRLTGVLQHVNTRYVSLCLSEYLCFTPTGAFKPFWVVQLVVWLVNHLRDTRTKKIQILFGPTPQKIINKKYFQYFSSQTYL